MSREWKPGDVAMIEVGCHANRFIGLFTHRGWRYGPDKWVADDPAIVTARPLVVIDPENREQVERLLSAILVHQPRELVTGDRNVWNGQFVDALTAALREFANPTPRIEEPLGDGAVVEDAMGHRWVRIAGSAVDSPPWRHRGHSGRFWDKVTAVRVLSEGVTS